MSDDRPGNSVLCELRTPFEAVTAMATLPIVAAAVPKGPPRTAMILPPFLGGDESTIALRGFLRLLGHRPHGWGEGANLGPAGDVVVRLKRRVATIVEREQGPIDLIGWSLGGVVARLIAESRPDWVRQVTTIGSPIRLDRSGTLVGGLFETVSSFVRLGGTPQFVSVDMIPVPSTAVWSASDGVVPGSACRQTAGPSADNVLVRGTHLAMGVNPAVFTVVAERLANDLDPWSPFTPPAALRPLFPRGS